MKHQGKEGFTWDSKAEDWAAWAHRCLEHDPPRNEKGRKMMADLIRQYEADVAAERTNQWSDPDPYRVISWRDYPPSGVKVWPAVVLLLVAIALFVWFAG